MNANFVLEELLSMKNQEKAEFLRRFFKTGKGQYGEGDILLGLTVPMVRDIVRRCSPLPLIEIRKLVHSKYHEVRLAGLLLLCKQFKKAPPTTQQQIYDFYLENARCANNWDLVDVTCRDVIGAYLLDKTDRSILRQLADSDNLWEQRIAIVSTWTFIKYGQFDDTLALSKQLMHHPHDLIHKAVGWMLREVGKKDKIVHWEFLETYATQLPRTALRYAIEHFAPEDRQYFMQMK
ncbi:DNA alkylation repair protein [Bacteroidia bacterium]|nr:DNA alkylation repair protein [Bacteroidia bacterium]